jgi:hypothetical protein
MFRKLMLAFFATSAIAAAALAPTAASAHKWHGHGHGHFHKHWGYYPAYYGGYGYGGGCFYVKKWVPSPYGMIKKPVLVCS